MVASDIGSPVVERRHQGASWEAEEGEVRRVPEEGEERKGAEAELWST